MKINEKNTLLINSKLVKLYLFNTYQAGNKAGLKPGIKAH